MLWLTHSSAGDARLARVLFVGGGVGRNVARGNRDERIFRTKNRALLTMIPTKGVVHTIADKSQSDRTHHICYHYHHQWIVVRNGDKTALMFFFTGTDNGSECECAIVCRRLCCVVCALRPQVQIIGLTTVCVSHAFIQPFPNNYIGKHSEHTYTHTNTQLRALVTPFTRLFALCNCNALCVTPQVNGHIARLSAACRATTV